MHIELMWNDANPNANVTTAIWRSDTEFEKDLLGATKIAEVPSGITRYLDEDTIYKQKYFYRLVQSAPGRKAIISKLFEFDNIPYNGPGPRVITFGDEHFGYYGVIDAALNAVPTIDQLRNFFGLPPLLNQRSNMASCHKFVVGGKIKAFYAMPIAIGTEISEQAPKIQHMLAKGSFTLNSGLHQWAVYIPTPLGDPAFVNTVSHFPGELSSMMDVTTDMYAPVIHNLYGNKTGNQITTAKGGVRFFDMLADLFPDQTLKHIITNHWKDRDEAGLDQTVTIDWTGPVETYPIRSKSIEPFMAQSPQIDWNECIIWIAMEYMNLTQPR